MKSVAYNKIIDFAMPQFSTSQFGFLSNRSTTAQLLKCHHEVMDALENKMHTDILYFDLKKAFDSVSHLLFKLWRMGVTRTLVLV